MKLLQGSRIRDGGETAVATPGVPTMPTWLADLPYAADCWTGLVEQLGGMGVLTTADGKILELYCVAYAQWREVASRREPSQARIAKAWGDLLLKLSCELGLTPSSRGRIKAVPKAAEPNALELFLAKSRMDGG